MLCAALLVSVGCDEQGDNDESMESGTGGEAGTPVADAGRDAQRVDTSVPPPQDARVVQDARTEAGEPNDARVVQGEPDASTDAATNNPPPDASMPNNGGTPLFVAVGYKGARLVSRDLGLTWTQSATLMGDGGDDANLLRAVSYHDGLFVAIGWKIWTSTDGTAWTERTFKGQQWMGGLEYGNGVFVAAGGNGDSLYSSDGLSWNKGKDSLGKHTRTVAFGGGKFIGATDDVKWWSTTDGNTWKLDSGGHATNQVMWCGDKFSDVKDCTTPLAHANAKTAFGMGVYISASGGKIERSTNGKDWTTVKDTKDSPVEDVAFGLLK